jgi:hypothetical protein
MIRQLAVTQLGEIGKKRSKNVFFIIKLCVKYISHNHIDYSCLLNMSNYVYLTEGKFYLSQGQYINFYA